MAILLSTATIGARRRRIALAVTRRSGHSDHDSGLRHRSRSDHMGVSGSVDPGRPDAARHSIHATFTRRVAVPAGCLALLWLLALAVGLRLALAGHPAAGSHAILIGYALLAVAGFAAIAAVA